MSEENFLTRWSRRKRAAQEEPDVKDEHAPATPTDPDSHPPETGETRPEAHASIGKPADEPLSELDLSKLPSLESITAATDIRPFLAAGVPQALRSAALRRAWSADPAIRDFVGLAENAWDFTAPGAIAGFGTLSASEAARVVASFTQMHAAGEAREASGTPDKTVQTAQDLGDDPAGDAGRPQLETAESADNNLPVSAEDLNLSQAGQAEATDPAAQSAPESEDAPAPPRHGTAMPH